jgi:hypothetical protein
MQYYSVVVGDARDVDVGGGSGSCSCGTEVDSM